MFPDEQKLKDLLLREHYVSPDDSTAAEQAAAAGGTTYIEYLLQTQLLNKSMLGQAIAESYGLAFYDFSVNPPEKELVVRIPEETARKYRVILIKLEAGIVTLATDNPPGILMDELHAIFRDSQLLMTYTLPESVEQALALYQKPLETRFSQIIAANERVAPEILEEIIRDALSYHASDIHFDPQMDAVYIRFRVDGSLHEAGVIPRENYDNVLNRLKVQSGMRIDEHYTAQDGSIRFEADGKQADLRASLVPTVYGEKVALRVLAQYVQGFGLNDIGLTGQYQQLVEECARKPFGMILTVGPTGSGKTTTLYAILKLLNRPDVNITTIEDPVEYRLAGINQIQVREQSNLTFAKGLRAIVRQDPNVILVGEIRDRETVEIAVNAALTGHLLLSTFHANDAATAIPRLIDMGAEPFLLASTVQVIIAQRLVRRICDHCRVSISLETALAANPLKDGHKYFEPGAMLYHGKGCMVCSNTGFRGRSALFEFIRMTPEMQELILDNPSTRQIQDLANKQGAVTMFQDGIDKVRKGVTSLGELLRVVEAPRSTTHVKSRT